MMYRRNSLEAQRLASVSYVDSYLNSYTLTGELNLVRVDFVSPESAAD